MKFVQKDLDSSINVNVTKASPVREFLILLLGVIGIIIIVYFLLGLVVNILTAEKNPKFEKKLGTIFSLGETGKSSEQVNKVFDSLLRNVEKDELKYSVSVVDDDKTENAVIFPGRRIMLYSGLLKNIKSENELFFILGHEVGHAENNDHVRSLGRGLVMVFISTAVMGENNFINRIFSESMQKSDRIYSQSQERRADLYAIDLVNKRYGHISGALDFFERLEKKEGKSLSLFSTHPSLENRIAELNKYIKKNGYKEGKKTDIILGK